MDISPDACYRAIATRDRRFDGRIFTGVKSTGIYCRPVCPARTPKRHNVVFFPSAAAAQDAGFRPCLRCRPETAPEIGAWRGTSNTVSRALALIEHGALDDSNLATLASRLGVGERHLRRLFDQHMGASPIAVAQTRRTLLAKQLIHETNLPMTDIALAAGFRSIRRFNETFAQLFGRSPSALRRELPTNAASEGISLRLRYRPPYDWDAMVAFLCQRCIVGIECVRGEQYARTFNLNGAHGIVCVRPGGDDSLHATVYTTRVAVLPQVIARLRRVFDLSADPHAIADHLQRDPALQPLLKARPGLRVPGGWDGFELALRAVLGQQISVRAAIQLAGRMIQLHGVALAQPHAAFPELTHVFPQPSVIASADLTALRMPQLRARALAELARTIAADPEIFGPRRSLEAAITQLRELPGVGEWTAQYIAMRLLREPDAFPAADVGLMRALAQQGIRPTPRELLARAETWRPWRAYAAQHLWEADSATRSRSDLQSRRAHVARATPERTQRRHAPT